VDYREGISEGQAMDGGNNRTENLREAQEVKRDMNVFGDRKNLGGKNEQSGGKNGKERRRGRLEERLKKA